MLFNSLHFILFFPVVTVLYFFLNQWGRIYLLLLASCYFYMVFKPGYLLILFFLIGIDYTAGIVIDKSEGEKRKLALCLSIVANLATLCFFKYYNFFADNISSLSDLFGWHTHLPYSNFILPIGLSFHTFQSMSYTIEVYRRKQKVETSLPHFALYVLFYPQLVAGPIERPQNLLPQFHTFQIFKHENVISGLRLMLWGMFKKVVIADKLAVIVKLVFDSPNEHSSLSLIIGAVCFAFQIYCDFSGYSDIAVGAARTMGYNLMQNFNTPYLSTSVTHFWRKWHISLSSWFRDYLYVPLGGNRVSRFRMYINIFIVFLLSGFWHGANWTFLVWGALHGLFLITEKIYAVRFGKKTQTTFIVSLAKGIFTFMIVTFAWVYFRANSVSDANNYLTLIFKNAHPFNALTLLNSTIDAAYLLKSLFLIILLLISEFLFGAYVLEGMANAIRFSKVRRLVYYALLLVLLFSDNIQQTFIYFQF